METLQPTPLRVLVYKEDGEYVAHVLEFDIVGTGSTVEEAEAQLSDAISCHLSFCIQENMNPMSKAPQEFFDIWNRKQEEIFTTPKRSERYKSFAYPIPDRDDQTVYQQFANH